MERKKERKRRDREKVVIRVKEVSDVFNIRYFKDGVVYCVVGC